MPAHPRMHPLARLDLQHVWHPFTQMRDWLKQEPIVITRAKGPYLWDAHNQRYLDANSSIWTNLHGHNHPKINAALRAQLKKIAHCSALGLANEPASLLAARLIQLANPSPLFPHPKSPKRSQPTPHTQSRLNRVFYSDNGSTAIEVALKQAHQFLIRTRGAARPRFLSLEGAYHGDTIGAVSLGHIPLFHGAYRDLLFQCDSIPAPYCYRCPFNRAKPERADARDYRQCQWECTTAIEKKFARAQKTRHPIAAFAYEPLIQGAAGLIPQPSGWLQRAAAIARHHNALLIADEVLTGFGRAGADPTGQPAFLASHLEHVQPDFAALAKGLTGGYLPMAATLTTDAVFNAFLGEYREFRSFFHGHSYTANPLGAAAALANLDLLELPSESLKRRQLELTLAESLPHLWSHPNVGDIRRVGLIVGIELVKDWRTREPFPIEQRVGFRVCEALARRGALSRPIGNVLVWMPPFCTSPSQARLTAQAWADAIDEVLGSDRPAFFIAPAPTPRHPRKKVR